MEEKLQRKVTQIKKLDLAGGTMTGSINMGNNEITNLPTPTGNSNASTKKYVDDIETKLLSDVALELIKKIDIGEIDMKGERIINLGNPLYSSDAINTSYLHNFMSAYLNTGGGTMEGQIDMNNNKIINLPEPTFCRKMQQQKILWRKVMFHKAGCKKM